MNTTTRMSKLSARAASIQRKYSDFYKKMTQTIIKLNSDDDQPIGWVQCEAVNLFCHPTGQPNFCCYNDKKCAHCWENDEVWRKITVHSTLQSEIEKEVVKRINEDVHDSDDCPFQKIRDSGVICGFCIKGLAFRDIEKANHIEMSSECAYNSSSEREVAVVAAVVEDVTVESSGLNEPSDLVEKVKRIADNMSSRTICIYCLFAQQYHPEWPSKPTSHSTISCGNYKSEDSHLSTLEYFRRYSTEQTVSVSNTLLRAKELEVLRSKNRPFFEAYRSKYEEVMEKPFKDVLYSCVSLDDKIYAIQDAEACLKMLLKERDCGDYVCTICSLHLLHCANPEQAFENEIFGIGEHVNENHDNNTWHKLSPHKDVAKKISACRDCWFECNLDLMYASHCEHNIPALDERREYKFPRSHNPPRTLESSVTTVPRMERSFKSASPGCWNNARQVLNFEQSDESVMSNRSQTMRDENKIELCVEVGQVVNRASHRHCINCLVYDCLNRRTHECDVLTLCENCTDSKSTIPFSHNSEECGFAEPCLREDGTYWRPKKNSSTRTVTEQCDFCKSQNRPYANHSTSECGHLQRMHGRPGKVGKLCVNCKNFGVKYDNHDTSECAFVLCECGKRHKKNQVCYCKICKRCQKTGKTDIYHRSGACPFNRY